MNVRHKVENARILIVEDEYFIMSDLYRIIDGGGNVCVAYNEIGDDIHQFDYSSVDIVIIDINLRNQLSYKVADMLKGRNIPFIFSTDYSGLSIDPEYMDTPLLTKPYHEQELVDIIAQFVGPPR